jgi:hypothetical protein
MEKYFFEKRRVAELVNEFPTFTRTEGLLPCSKKLATDPYILSQMNPAQIFVSYFKINFNIIPLRTCYA